YRDVQVRSARDNLADAIPLVLALERVVADLRRLARIREENHRRDVYADCPVRLGPSSDGSDRVNGLANYVWGRWACVEKPPNRFDVGWGARIPRSDPLQVGRH